MLFCFGEFNIIILNFDLLVFFSAVLRPFLKCYLLVVLVTEIEELGAESVRQWAKYFKAANYGREVVRL